MSGAGRLRLWLLGIWAGGLATWSLIVVPAAFATLPGTDLAGALVGVSLDNLERAGIALGLGAVLLGLADRGAAGDRARPRSRNVRVWLPALAVALHALSSFWISPEIRSIRAAAGGALGNLVTDGSEITRFGNLHTLSTGAFTLSAITVLTTALWDWTRTFAAARSTLQSSATVEDS